MTTEFFLLKLIPSGPKTYSDSELRLDCTTKILTIPRLAILNSLLNLLSGKESSEIIWTADLEYWVAGQRITGKLKREYDGEEGRLKLSHDLGVMPYYWYEQFWLAEPIYNGVTVTIEKVGETSTRRWITPIGQLEEISVFSKKSCSQASIKHPVQNERDLEVLLYILKQRQLKPVSLDNYNKRRELYAGYDGIPSIGLPRSPLSALAVEWCGIENLVYLMMDYPDLIEKILGLFEQQEKPIIEALCKIAPPLVHFADNLTSDCYTSYFDKYMAEPYRRRLGALHCADVKCAVHLDGTVRGLLPKLADIGIDAIEALTPVPAGDVPVEEMRKLAGNDDVILWGGIPGTMFCEPYTWDDMKTHVEKLIQSWSGQRFIIGVADQIPANGDIEKCRKISEMIREISK